MWIICMKTLLTPMVGKDKKVLAFNSEHDAKKYIDEEVRLSPTYFSFYELDDVSEYPKVLGTTGSGECPKCHLRWIVKGTDDEKDQEVHFILHEKCSTPCAICVGVFKHGQSFV